MKKTIYLVCLLIFGFVGPLQAQFFQATLEKDGMDLVVKIRPFPSGGDISTAFSGMEFFIRYDEAMTPAFSYGSISTNTSDFPTVTISNAGDNVQGMEAGYTNNWFVWSGIPTASSVFTDGVEVEVFRVTLDIDPATGDFELVHSTFFTPHYLALNSETGSDLTPVTDSPGTHVFYGSGASICVGCGSGGSDLFLFSLNASLPVELRLFSVSQQENKWALLEWTTEAEQNSSHFEIERSSDGQNWESIGQVESNGFATAENHYLFQDLEAIHYSNPEGWLYFRLKMVDLDATYEYSSIQSIQFEKTLLINDLLIYPNPSLEGVFIQTNGNLPTGDYALQLMDPTGKELGLQKINLLEGTPSYFRFPQNFNPGLYFLNILRYEHVVFSQKLIIGEK